jgi:shikimate dehydrogenase
LRIYGLIGYPLGHSFSASYFSRKFEKEGIEASYRNFPIEDLKELDGFLESIAEQETLVKGVSDPDIRAGDLAGLNVTVPYKQAVVPHLHSLSDTARAVGAVNTISIIRKGGGLQLHGDNTDVIGFRESLEKKLSSKHTSALVLGTGGSSRAVVHVLEHLGIGVTMVSRSAGEGKVPYKELDSELLAGTPLIINTTPLGMYPRVEGFPRIPYDAIGPGHLLFDLVYNPEKTLFLSLGEEQGATIVNGYEMLCGQAEGSWRIWNKL